MHICSIGTESEALGVTCAMLKSMTKAIYCLRIFWATITVNPWLILPQINAFTQYYGCSEELVYQRCSWHDCDVEGI